MCRVCSGALYEPVHEITVLVRWSCNEGSDEPSKMRMLARVPTKDKNVRLTLEEEYRIATETHVLHAADTLNSNSCWCSSRWCCRGRWFESR